LTKACRCASAAGSRWTSSKQPTTQLPSSFARVW
jgi:hypothetical protein